MLVKSIMSKPVITVQQDHHVGQALELMKSNHIRHLPVINPAGCLVGLVSENDLLKVYPRKILNSYEKTLLSRTPVKTVMVSDPQSIGPEDTIEEAAQIMQQCMLVCLPVVENKKVIGVLCDNDVLRSFISVLGIGQPGLRVTINYTRKKGFLAELVQLLDQNNAVIDKLVTFQNELVLKLQTDNPQQLCDVLEASGYQISHHTEVPSLVISCANPDYQTDMEQTS